jgi:uncharacterized membrane protein (Fun14 family)
MAAREIHWKVTGWRASAIVGTLAAVPFATVFAAGFFLGRIT